MLSVAGSGLRKSGTFIGNSTCIRVSAEDKGETKVNVVAAKEDIKHIVPEGM